MPPTTTHYRFAMGELDGLPSFVLQTRAGISWGNISPALQSILEKVQDDDVLDFSLGSQGRFYVRWQEAGRVRRKLSTRLWDELEPSHHAHLDRLTLGPCSFHWGVYVDKNVEVDFSRAPYSFFTAMLGVQRRKSSWNEVKFVAFGYAQQWAFNINGTVRYSSLNARFRDIMGWAMRSGREVTSIVFSLTNYRDFLIVMDDGSVYFTLDSLKKYYVGDLFDSSDSLILKPLLRKLASESDDFLRVKTQFLDGWNHPDVPVPTVQRIYSIDIRDNLQKLYDDYRSILLGRLGIPGINEQLRFYGAYRGCGLGTGPRDDSLCNSAWCDICCILRKSFGVYGVGFVHRRGFWPLRYGIYTTPFSSKAHETTSTQRDRPFRAMILAKVLLGRGCPVYSTSTSLTGPPSGFDSVIGRAGVIHDYDQQAVFRDDAIRPAYLIIYDA